jgi:retinol-binding protein 3
MIAKARATLTSLAILTALALSSGAQPVQQARAAQLNDAERGAIIEVLAADIDTIYIFPEVATEMIAKLEAQRVSGAYDELVDLPAYCGQLTADLQSVSHDLHLSVRPMPPQMINAEQGVDREQVQRDYLARARRSNYGFKKLEILGGNVGYLDLRGFSDASIGAPTAIAAMNYLAGSEAIIIDLRNNGGGSPSMIQLILSYFFEEPTHLNDFYIRSTDTTDQFWTQAHVAGPRMTDTPLYVLTSGRTFSAAEEFSYNLRNLERATLVGETTGGGAHPVNMMRYPEQGVSMSLPFGRAINPITGTNWEGTGVEPHVKVSAAEAFDAAYAKALEGIVAGAVDPGHKAQLAWLIDGLQAKPQELKADELAAFTGSYGPRKVRVEGGKLLYQRGEGALLELTAVGDDNFHVSEVDFFRIRFERDASGKVVTLVGRYDDGREEPSPRSE